MSKERSLILILQAVIVSSREVGRYIVSSSLIFFIVFVFNAITDAMGGPSFNPTGNVALYAARFGDDTLISMAICFLAQAVGVIGGLLALYEVMSSEYKNLLVEPYLKVDLHTGAIAEGVLTFVITVVVLCIIFKGPWSALVKTLMITICTLGVIIVGNDYTGSSMYPANVSPIHIESGNADAPKVLVSFRVFTYSVNAGYDHAFKEWNGYSTYMNEDGMQV
ncbi:aquaporin SIP1-2-like [Zingiber officinale]|uniref:aquaporin SIP1-2-like n=1 Tax=Zingiber officinale TaxID=94328 RepID=UPI001C4D06AF|nr:aquaporin SIP1-2-like [Zingiber officinale]